MFDERTMTRLRDLAAGARDALPPAELARRRSWAAANHDNLQMRHDGEDLVLCWGGAELARVDPETLAAMRTEERVDLVLDLRPDVPDSPADLVGPNDDLHRFPYAQDVYDLLLRLDRARLEHVARWIAHRLAGDLR